MRSVRFICTEVLWLCSIQSCKCFMWEQEDVCGCKTAVYIMNCIVTLFILSIDTRIDLYRRIGIELPASVRNTHTKGNCKPTMLVVR